MAYLDKLLRKQLQQYLNLAYRINLRKNCCASQCWTYWVTYEAGPDRSAGFKAWLPPDYSFWQMCSTWLAAGKGSSSQVPPMGGHTRLPSFQALCFSWGYVGSESAGGLTLCHLFPSLCVSLHLEYIHFKKNASACHGLKCKRQRLNPYIPK